MRKASSITGSLGRGKAGRLRGARRRGERGQALIIFVLAAGVLFGMVALAIDVGLILHERRELQNAADAAALAGAIELPESEVLAGFQAHEWAVKNGIDIGEGDEVEITVSPAENSVTVEVRRETSFIFGRVLGLTTIDVHASATAQIGSPASLAGVLPFGVLESAINDDGSPTTLKYDASQPTNGNFGPIRVDGNGSKIHEQTIINGSENAVCGLSQPSCEDATVNTQTGNLIGATRDGFNYRFENTSTECDEFDEVLIPRDDGQYELTGRCNPFGGATDSYRLVLVPVLETFCNGNCEVTILYFAAMFLNELGDCQGSDCEVTGTFVQVVADPTYDAVLGIYDENSGIKFIRLVA